MVYLEYSWYNRFREEDDSDNDELGVQDQEVGHGAAYYTRYVANKPIKLKQCHAAPGRLKISTVLIKWYIV